MVRREFFIKAVRLLMLGGMTAAAAYLVAERKVSLTAQCGLAQSCTGCSRYSGCNEQQARNLRDNSDTTGKTIEQKK
jgi:hypothetical protein